MMEDLLYKCSNLAINTNPNKWYNNTTHQLYLKCIEETNEERVYTRNNIAKHDFIGYIVGEQKYTWNVPPNKECVWLNDYYLLDCSAYPRCITSIIRKTHDDTSYNCTMAFSFANNKITVYVIATQNIYAGSELVIKPENLDYY
jgi:hypothetical protein